MKTTELISSLIQRLQEIDIEYAFEIIETLKDSLQEVTDSLYEHTTTLEAAINDLDNIKQQIEGLNDNDEEKEPF